MPIDLDDFLARRRGWEKPLSRRRLPWWGWGVILGLAGSIALIWGIDRWL